MEDCFICEKHKGTINTAGGTIYENDLVYVGHIDRKGKPNYLGHIMVDLKRHVPELSDMSIEEAKEFGLIVSRVSRALHKTEDAEHVYAQVLGDGVPHLHLHLIARYPNTPEEFWGPTKVYEWDESPFGNSSDVAKVSHRIKNYLEKEEIDHV